MRISFLLLLTVPICSVMMSTGSFGGMDLPDSSSQSNILVSAPNGASLFAGTVRFQNGGPPCAACHAASGLPFPNGGSLGPDLSQATARLGSEGMDTALQTLFFPTMTPIFDEHPLTVAEQHDLKSFLKQAQSSPATPDPTPVMASIAVVGLLVLLAFTWGVWRNRLRGVRRTLVRSAGGDTR